MWWFCGRIRFYHWKASLRPSSCSMIDDTKVQRSAVTCLKSHSGSWQGQNSSASFFDYSSVALSTVSQRPPAYCWEQQSPVSVKTVIRMRESGFSNTLLGWVINMYTSSLQSCVDLGRFYGKYTSYIYFSSILKYKVVIKNWEFMVLPFYVVFLYFISHPNFQRSAYWCIVKPKL